MFLYHLHTTCTLGRPKCLIRLWVYFWQNIYTQYCFLLYHIRKQPGASQVVQVVKNLPANIGDLRDMGLMPGLGRSLGEGHGNPLQYSCLENPMDKGVWQTKSIGSQRVRHDWSVFAHTHEARYLTVTLFTILNYLWVQSMSVCSHPSQCSLLAFYLINGFSRYWWSILKSITSFGVTKC